MGIEKDKRDYKYPFIEYADAKLRERCKKRLEERYIGQKREMADLRLNEELAIISRQGSASGYLTLLDALDSAGFKPDDICIRGTSASSLVVYLTGLSDIEPLEVKPSLYSEFYFGADGERLPAFEMNVSPDLLDRLLDYYEHYIGELNGEVRLGYRLGERQKSLKVCMYCFDEDEDRDRLFYDNFHFIFMTMGVRNRQPSDFVTEEIIKDYNPKTYADYVKCFGLSRGTGVWEDNAEGLLSEGVVLPIELIADREDIYECLMRHGIEKRTAFDMAEDVRKGRIMRYGWKTEQLEIMREKEVPGWFVESCAKIRYLFTRAHAMVYLKTYCNMDPARQDI